MVVRLGRFNFRLSVRGTSRLGTTDLVATRRYGETLGRSTNCRLFTVLILAKLLLASEAPPGYPLERQKPAPVNGGFPGLREYRACYIIKA